MEAQGKAGAVCALPPAGPAERTLQRTARSSTQPQDWIRCGRKGVGTSGLLTPLAPPPRHLTHRWIRCGRKGVGTSGRAIGKGATFLGGDFIIYDAVVFAVVIWVKKVEVIDAFIYAGYFLGPSDDMLAFASESDQKR